MSLRSTRASRGLCTPWPSVRRLDNRRLARAARATVEALEVRTLLSGTLPAAVHASSDAVYSVSGNVTNGYAVTLSAGTFSFDANEGAATGDWPGLSLTVSGAAVVAFNSPETFNALTLSGTSKLTATSSGGGSAGNVLTVGTGGFSMPLDPTTHLPTATLDLMDNDMLLQGAGSAELPVLQALLLNALPAGGTGLGSSDAAASPTTNKTALGYGLNGSTVNFSTFDGQPVVPGDILVKYTLAGDANFDGLVGNIDYGILRSHLNRPGTIWTTGDFNYDTQTDSADYGLLSNNFGQDLTGPNYARTIQPVGLPVSAVEGQPFTGALATFTDALNTTSNPTNAGEYQSSVDWGDGTFVAATVTADGLGDGGYVVTTTSPSPLSNPDALIVTKVQYSSASGLQGRPASLGEPVVSITPVVAGLSAVPVSVGQVNLYWTLNADNATGIEVDRADDGGAYSVLTTTAAGNATSYIDNTVSEGHSYDYEVRAIHAAPADPSAYAAPAYATTQTVDGLGATAASPSEIDLSWAAFTGAATSIEIDRSADGINFTPEATVAASASAFQDTGLSEASRYYYQLKAVYGTVASAPCPPVDAYTNPAAPSGLTATMVSANGVNAVDLSWTNNSQGASAFDIVRTDSNGETFDLGNVAAPTTIFVDLNAPPGQTASYSVTALTPASTSGQTGISPSSNVATATTPVASVDTLLTTTVTSSEIDLAWNNDVPDATGIVVYGSTDGQTYSLLTPTPLSPDATSYQETGLAGGSLYYLSVDAVGSPTQPNAWFVQTGGHLTAPSTPVLTASANNDGSVALDWGGSGFDFSTQFRVNRTDSAGNTQFIGNFTTTTCTDLPSVTDIYQYTVQAIDLNGNESGVSNAVSLTVNRGVQPLATGAATVLFVNGSVAQSGNGTTLQAAFKTIQEAANAAAALHPTAGSPVVVEIATGGYREMVTVKCGFVAFTSFNGPVAVSGLNQIPVTADSTCTITSISSVASGSDNLVTAHVTNNTFATNDIANITGVTVAAYDGFFKITAVDHTAGTITYLVHGPPVLPSSSTLGLNPTAQSITWSSAALPTTNAGGNGYSAVTNQLVLGPSATTATDQVFIDSPGAVLLPEARFPQDHTPGLPDTGDETNYASGSNVSLLRIPDQTKYQLPSPPSIMTSATFYDPSLSAIQTALLDTSVSLPSVLNGAIIHIAPGAAGFAKSGVFSTDIWETYQITAVPQINGTYGITYSIPAGSVLQNPFQQPQWGDFYYLTNLNVTPKQALLMGARSVPVSSITKATGTTSKMTDTADTYVVDSNNVLHVSAYGSPIVEVKERDIAFDLSGEPNVSVQNITLIAATIVTDKSSTAATISGVTAQFLSAYDRTGINVVVDHTGPFLNAQAGQSTPPSVFTAFSHGYLQFDSGIQLLGADDMLKGSVIDSCSASGVTVGADGVTVTACRVTNADIMGSDNAPIVTDGSTRPITGVAITTLSPFDLAKQSGTLAPLLNAAATPYEGMVQFDLTIPYNPAIVTGVWIYVANLQIENPVTHAKFVDTYAGDGTYLVTRTTPPSGGFMDVFYQAREPNYSFGPYYDGYYMRDGGSSAAGVVSVVVGQNGPVNISDNVVANSSRSGITYRGAINVNIFHNDVSGAGLDTTDLGGIYAWGEDVSSLSSNSNVVISYNTVHDMQSGIETGPGIYADNGNSGVKIEHNIVYNAEFGVQVSSGGMNILVEYNTLDATQSKSNSFNPILPSSIHSGPVAYYNSTTNTIVNGNAGIRYNTIALYNNLGVNPDPSGTPSSSMTADTSNTLYGFNLGTFSVASGNNVAVAHTSNGAGGDSSTIQAPQTLDAKAQSGIAYIYEDLGAALSTLFHTTRIHMIFGSALPTAISVAVSNDHMSWTNVITGIPDNGATVYDTTINLISRYVKFIFQPANGSDVKVAQIEILGTDDLAAVSDTAYPATIDLSQAKAAVVNGAPGPVPSLGDVGTAFTPNDFFPNSYIYVDLGASVRIDLADTVQTGSFSIYCSNVTTSWAPLTSGGTYARYLLYALAPGAPFLGSVYDVPVLGTA